MFNLIIGTIIETPQPKKNQEENEENEEEQNVKKVYFPIELYMN